MEMTARLDSYKVLKMAPNLVDLVPSAGSIWFLEPLPCDFIQGMECTSM